MKPYFDSLSSAGFWASALICMMSIGFPCPTGAEEGRIHLNYGSIRGSLPITTWKSMRDSLIEKQNEDDSCGAAAVATVLRFFYHQDVHEKDVLDEIIRTGGKGTISFSDLERVVDKFGFRAGGFPMSFDDLKATRFPTIVYLRYRDNDHFSVIRGIDDKGMVWLGDPSWGNRKFTAHQFRAMWETRNDNTLKGRVLVIVPKDKKSVEMNQEFFRDPDINSIAVQILVVLNL